MQNGYDAVQSSDNNERLDSEQEMGQEKLAETIRAHVGVGENIKSAVRRVSTKRIFTIAVGAVSRPI